MWHTATHQKYRHDMIQSHNPNIMSLELFEKHSFESFDTRNTQRDALLFQMIMKCCTSCHNTIQQTVDSSSSSSLSSPQMQSVHVNIIKLYFVNLVNLENVVSTDAKFSIRFCTYSIHLRFELRVKSCTSWITWLANFVSLKFH